jgi:8-oxo-dGTP pyrophosphatase MutT (NUDIX family)
MADDWPKIKARQTTTVSPWIKLVAREVEFLAGAPPETYHAIAQADYLAIVALTPDGKIPIVRQFRPAVERFTWELPAGMVDQGETPQECCVRELKEETGFSARAVHTLGAYAPCTARLSNQVHSFFVETGEQGKPSEPDIELRLVTPAELGRLIKTAEFPLQLHIGALLLAGLHGFIDLGGLNGGK